MTKKEIKGILLALGIGTVVLTGCNNNEKEDSVLFNTILDDVSDSTCTDEILNLEENKEVLTDFYILDRYLSLSEKLHSLELEKTVTKEKLDSNLEILSIDDIESYISKIECESPEEDQYKSDAELLLVNEGYINKMLHECGNSTTLKMAALVAKAKIVDALGLSMEEYKNINILENLENYDCSYSRIQVEYLKKEGNRIYYQLCLDEAGGHENLISQCIHIVDKNREKEEEPTKNQYNLVEYNSSRNKELYEDCQTIKQAMYATYEVKDESIIQTADNAAVKETYKAKVKSFR